MKSPKDAKKENDSIVVLYDDEDYRYTQVADAFFTGLLPQLPPIEDVRIGFENFQKEKSLEVIQRAAKQLLNAGRHRDVFNALYNSLGMFLSTTGYGERACKSLLKKSFRKPPNTKTKASFKSKENAKISPSKIASQAILNSYASLLRARSFQVSIALLTIKSKIWGTLGIRRSMLIRDCSLFWRDPRRKTCETRIRDACSVLQLITPLVPKTSFAVGSQKRSCYDLSVHQEEVLKALHPACKLKRKALAEKISPGGGDAAEKMVSRAINGDKKRKTPGLEQMKLVRRVPGGGFALTEEGFQEASHHMA